MSVTENDSAKRINIAEDRLARAIDRLQAALQAQAQNHTAGAPDPALAEELSRLQSENGALRALVGDAGTRLDATISKLKTQMAG